MNELLTKALKATTDKAKKPKAKKVTYNKFFPDYAGFITFEGIFNDSEDWNAEVTLQNGLNRYVSFWVSDYKPDTELKQLKAFIEGAQKAVDFIEESMKKQKPISVDEKRVTKQRK